ncbi:hypothetical protein [Leptospira kirschneri]|uniref:hypothetical protein n=1 Tax=Leptospira kirschneri TaxID=29507 RepID=UPI00035D72EA|nr:hypothetical protein [Leptospira kirschneri]
MEKTFLSSISKGYNKDIILYLEQIRFIRYRLYLKTKLFLTYKNKRLFPKKFFIYSASQNLNRKVLVESLRANAPNFSLYRKDQAAATKASRFYWRSTGSYESLKTIRDRLMNKIH